MSGIDGIIYVDSSVELYAEPASRVRVGDYMNCGDDYAAEVESVEPDGDYVLIDGLRFHMDEVVWIVCD